MWLDRMLATRVRGMGRIRRLLRCGAPITLIRSTTSDGIELALDPEGYVDRAIIDSGYYEREILLAILEHLPQQGVFWDIGANIGLHSLSVKRARPDVRVFAFEPVPSTAARLISNSVRAKLDVTALCIALGDSDGYLPMSIMIRGNTGLSSLQPWKNVDYDASFCCRTERAQALVHAGIVESPSVIKIDVEGFETQVLKGFGSMLNAKSLRAIVFESGPEKLAEIETLLAGFGFTVSPLHSVEHKNSSEPATNFLATKAVS